MRKKIAIVAPQFPPQIGGMQAYAWEVAKDLAERNYDVTVFTLRQPIEELPKVEFKIWPCLSGQSWRDKKVIADNSGRFDLWHVMNAAWSWVANHVNPVFLSVHGNDFLDPNTVVRVGLRDRFHLPWSSRLDFMIGKWLTIRSLNSSLDKITHIFTNSKATRRLFVERYSRVAGKTSVGLVGVSRRYLNAVRMEKSITSISRLVTVCRLDERSKNVHLVLAALAMIRHQFEFEYTIIGDGELRCELERLAEELGIADRVSFLGRCPDERLTKELLSSDLFILTSAESKTTVEGFGIVYLEASACGLPVLAARLGGAVEAVAEGKSGFFVESISPESIAASITRIITGKLNLASSDCQEFARRFSWKNVVDRFIVEYERAGISVGPGIQAVNFH